MALWQISLIVSFATFLVVAGQKRALPSNCPDCHEDACKMPKNCPAGPVMDRCSCCYVCAQKEGEACDLGKEYKFGSCGEHLECRIRNDVDGRFHSATCQCREKGTICGDNGVTYDNLCQMKADANQQGIEIVPKFKHPCKTVPSIRSPPSSIKNLTGSNVFLSCEVSGYPIPAITWTWTNAEQEIFKLPTDDLHISVNSRGGPEKYMLTSWVQIMDLREEHQGDYTCKVENEAGLATAVARVNVVDPGRF